MYQNNFKHNAFVPSEGYNCNKLYEITPKKNFLWDPEEEIQRPETSLNEISRMTILPVKFNFSDSYKKKSDTA